jgi:dTDP-4-dehydro-6-deoxy-alpha-D-glucopyranose 2,3-dehydratase
VIRDFERFSSSAQSFDNRRQPLSEVRAWLARARSDQARRVERVDLDALEGWSMAADGALVHASGGFFRVAGVRVAGTLGRWDQPLVEQFEVGTLGFAVADIDGLLHVLVQAKMEPGSPGLVQLAPTLQATHGNATRLHRGRAPAFAALFDGAGVGAKAARVVVEAVLPELGAHFSRKRNRNVIVELREPIDPPPNFRWLTLAELQSLAREPDLVNMPARSVLALAPLFAEAREGQLELGEHSLAELRGWLAARAAALHIEHEHRPLAELDGWRLADGSLSDVDERLWSIVGVRVRAPDREVGAWSQPLLHRPHEGCAGLLLQRRRGLLHLLLEARFELGTGVTLAPTVTADGGDACPWERGESPLLPWFDEPDGEVLLDLRLAREGGRYWQTRHRYRAVCLPEASAPAIPDSHRWVTLAQLRWFLRHGDRVHLDARELLALLPGLASER